MTKESWFKVLMDSGVPMETVKGFFTLLGQIAQSTTANPISAAIGGTILIGMCKKVGLLDASIADWGLAGVLGMSIADVAATDIAKIGTVIPFSNIFSTQNIESNFPKTVVFVNAPPGVDYMKLLPKEMTDK